MIDLSYLGRILLDSGYQGNQSVALLEVQSETLPLAIPVDKALLWTPGYRTKLRFGLL
jgi:hypothetical protein